MKILNIEKVFNPFDFQVKGIEESDVTPGFVLCCPTNPIKTGRVFDAQVIF